jgi:aldehyde dehydrogenase (NAD+)
MCGGYRLTEGDLKYGYFYAPTVFADVHPSMQIAQDEIFGPVVCVIPFGTLDEAIEIANGVRYGLSSAIYTRDVRNAMVAIRELQAGITYVNAPSIGAEIHLPFGGVKQTGNGHREGGTQVLDIFSEWKTVYIDYSGRLQRAQIDTDRLVQLGD